MKLNFNIATADFGAENLVIRYLLVTLHPICAIRVLECI